MTYSFYPRPGLAEVYVAKIAYKASLVSAGPAGGERWHFQPFGRTLVKSAVPVDERHILLTADDEAATVAVYDVVDRREVARRADVFWRSIVGFTVSRDGRKLLVYRGAFLGDAQPLPRFLTLPALTDLTGYPAPGPRKMIPAPEQPLRLMGIDAAERRDGSFLVTLGTGGPVWTTCVVSPEGGFRLNERPIDHPDEAALRLEALSPAGSFMIRRARDQLLVQRTGTDGILQRLGLLARNRPRETTASTVYGIGVEVWRTDPLELSHRIVVHGLSVEDARFLKENLRPDVGTRSIDFLFTSRKLPEPLPLEDHAWQGDAAYWVYPKTPVTSAVDYLSEKARSVPADYLDTIEWEPDESGFTITLADKRRRRIGLDGEVGPLLDPLPPVYPYAYPRETTPAIDAADAALQAITRAAIPVRDLSESQCVRAVARLAARVRRRLPSLVFGHELNLLFEVGDTTMGEREFFEHVREHCPGARDALRELFAAYAAKAPKIPLELVSQLYHDEENGALTFAAAALASMDPDAFEHLQGWFDLRDPGHEIGATDAVLPEIARVGHWRSAAHIRFGIHERARQSLEGTGGVRLSDFGILDAARERLSPGEFAGCLEDVAVRLSSRFRFSRDDADRTLHEMVLADLQADEPWDKAVRDRLALNSVA